MRERILRIASHRLTGFVIGVLLVLAVGVVTYRSVHRDKGPVIRIDFANAGGLESGASYEVNGSRVGQVVEVMPLRSGITVRVQLEDNELARAVCREGTEHFIDQLGVEKGDAVGANRILTGSAIKANLTPDDAAKPCYTFQAEGLPYLLPGIDITVEYADVHGLRVRAPVEMNGIAVGVVFAIAPNSSGTGAIVKLRLHDSAGASALKLLISKETRYYIERTRLVGLEARGEGRILSGPVVVARPPTTPGATTLLFHAEGDEPPDPRVNAKSPRHALRFTDAKGLRERAPVLIDGVEVGSVEQVDWSNGIIIAFHDEKAAAAAKRNSTRWYIDSVSADILGVRGDPASLLSGPRLVAVIDPLAPSGETRSEFSTGQNGFPPENRHQHDEKRVWARCAERFSEDSAVLYRGDIVGFVHAVIPAHDGSGYIHELRIYRQGQRYLYTGSKFFKQTRYELQFGKWEGWLSFQGPRMNIPDAKAMLKPAIEFRTPPAPDCGEPFRYPGGDTAGFTIEPKAEEAWLNWTTSATPTEKIAELNLGEICTSTVSLKWQKRPTMVYFQHHAAGACLYVPGGVIAVRHLLEQDMGVDSNDIQVDEFTLGGRAASWAAPPLPPLGHEIRFMKVDLAGAGVTPMARLGSIGGPEDLIVIASNNDRRPIAKTKLSLKDNHCLSIDPAEASINTSCHGAPVVACSGPAAGRVVGLIRSDGAHKEVLLFEPDVEKLIRE